LLGLSQEWRQVIAPLLLILLMLYRPRGIMGLREFRFLTPHDEQPEALEEYKKQVQIVTPAKEASL